mmetsp:Transcript_15261/g.20971  ORF Transcript_15261/g.20971 Transcript_15261/m.20971 type:complete len:581 (+) Transcript_15261:23-1765(+)
MLTNPQEISPISRLTPSFLDLSFESAPFTPSAINDHVQQKENGDKMSQLFVYILADVLKDMVKHLNAGDKLSAFSCSKKARNLIIQNGYNHNSNSGIICDKYKEFSKMHINMLFGESVAYICSEPPFHDSSKSPKRLCLQLLIEIFRIEDIFANESSPLVLSEMYVELANYRVKQGHYEDAVEFAGRSLHIRVNLYSSLNQFGESSSRYGNIKKLIDIKISDSHYLLAHIYKLKGDFEKSKKDLALSRILKSKIYGELSLIVSNCDFTLGQIESAAMDRNRSYTAFYLCYRTRLVLLGPKHLQSIAAEKCMLLQKCKTSEENVVIQDSIICGYELKDHALKLQLHEYEHHTYEYCMYLLIYRINNEDVFTYEQLRFLVISAIQYSEHANITNNNEVIPSVEKQIHDINSDRIETLTASLLGPFHSIGSNDKVAPYKISLQEKVPENVVFNQQTSLSSGCTGNEVQPKQLQQQQLPSHNDQREVQLEHEKVIETKKAISIFHEKATVMSSQEARYPSEDDGSRQRTIGRLIRRDADNKEGLVSWDGRHINIYKPMRSPNSPANRYSSEPPATSILSEDLGS